MCGGWTLEAHMIRRCSHAGQVKQVSKQGRSTIPERIKAGEMLSMCMQRAGHVDREVHRLRSMVFKGQRAILPNHTGPHESEAKGVLECGLSRRREEDNTQ